MRRVQHASLEEDGPILEEDLDILHDLQDELVGDIEWEIGDVLIVDVGFYLDDLDEDKDERIPIVI
jgi:hydrogenase maturation factor